MKPEVRDERDEYSEDPEGWAKRWTMEFTAAKKEVEPWHKAAEKILARFRDERKDEKEGNSNATRWNLFTANIQTQRCLLYGKTPKVDVARKFGDATDDTARVAAEMLERMLNCDIQRDSDTYAYALECALDDRLLVGLGNVRVRYVADFKPQGGKAAIIGMDGKERAPAVPGTDTREGEDVEVDWLHWKDQLWSAGSRTHHERRWWAFRAQMTKRDMVKRFGDVAKDVSLTAPSSTGSSSDKPTPWSRADVWEIWSKEDKAVYWFVEGHQKTLDMKRDPLGLAGFWPCPRPMAANLTTSTLVPRPDFLIAQDLYNEVDTVSTRITLLIEALRVAGVYDKSAGTNVMQLVKGRENELIPADNWAMFAEKGGLKGLIDWFPLEQVASTVVALRDYRTECVATLYQVTGMSDIMRGQSGEGGVTATEQGIKARFASVRMQAMQDEFARFASDVQKLKAEIIAKHFTPETILERSNVAFTADKDMAQAAVQFLQSNQSAYRVEVKPEAVSLADFAANRQEASEAIAALSQFLTAAAPLAQALPNSQPYLLEMLAAAMANFRWFDKKVEGTFDRAIAEAQQAKDAAAQNPQAAAPPDPKLQAQQMKMQGDQMKAQLDMQRETQKSQNDMARIQAETAAHAEMERTQAVFNVAEAKAKHAITRADALPAFTPQSPGV